MGTLDEFKTRIRNMLFVSIKNDIDSWYYDSYDKEYLSPPYDDYKIVLDKRSLHLRKKNEDGGYSRRLVLKYRNAFRVKDKEVNDCIKKLKAYFEKKEEDKKLKSEIDFFEKGLSKIQESYIFEVRKEKLEKLENDETK